MLLFIFVGVLPLQINTTSKDSTETNFRITGGLGQYAHISRGCEGNVLDKEKIPFSEIGVSIDHKTKTPLRLGLNVSYIFTKEESELVYYSYGQKYVRYAGNQRPIEIFTVNPFINAEWKNFAIGGGAFWANRPTFYNNDNSLGHFGSWYIRIGNIRSFYIDISLLHTTPVFSGSCFKSGLGFRSNHNIDLWFGIGYQPYDNIGFIAKTNIPIQPHLFLDALYRLGGSEGVSENAISLGLTYKLIGGK